MKKKKRKSLVQMFVPSIITKYRQLNTTESLDLKKELMLSLFCVMVNTTKHLHKSDKSCPSTRLDKTLQRNSTPFKLHKLVTICYKASLSLCKDCKLHLI